MGDRASPGWRAAVGPIAACLAVLASLPTAARGQPSGDAAGFMARARAAAAMGAPPPACEAPRADAAGNVTASSLPGKIEGAAAGTTGGLGRRLLLVTRADDPSLRATEPGTLRWALAEAKRGGGGWVLFDPALAGRTIRLAAALRIPSNTTVDGGCGGITLSGAVRTTLMLVQDEANIVVSGLSFVKEAYADGEDQAGDAVGLTGGFDRVAILHNAFSRCGDGCVDIVRKQPLEIASRVTVAFNRFSDHNKVMLVGSLTCYVDRLAPGCDDPLTHLSGSMRPSLRVTLQANLFEQTSQRHPKVVSNGLVQSVNNVLVLASTRYANGKDSAVYGAAAASGGVLTARGDVVVNPTPRPRMGTGPVSALRERQEVGGEAGGETDGAVSVSGVATIGRVRLVENRAEVAASLGTDGVRALDALPDPVRLAACVIRAAGPEHAGVAWPAGCE